MIMGRAAAQGQAMWRRVRSRSVTLPGATRADTVRGIQVSSPATRRSGFCRTGSHSTYRPAASVRRVYDSSRPSTQTSVPASGTTEPEQVRPPSVPVTAPHDRGATVSNATWTERWSYGVSSPRTSSAPRYDPGPSPAAPASDTVTSRLSAGASVAAGASTDSQDASRSLPQSVYPGSVSLNGRPE